MISFFLSFKVFSFSTYIIILSIDLLIFNLIYNVLIYTSYKYTIYSTTVARYIYDYYKAVVLASKIQEYTRLFISTSLLPTYKVKQLYVPRSTPPIAYL